MHATDIVGYQYAGEFYCPDDMRNIAAYKLAAPGEAAFMGRPTDGDSTEEFLARWAERFGYDRMDERSYDSDEFPKVVFADAVHDVCSPGNGYEPGQCGDYCAECHEPLGFDCPNVPES